MLDCSRGLSTRYTTADSTVDENSRVWPGNINKDCSCYTTIQTLFFVDVTNLTESSVIPTAAELNKVSICSTRWRHTCIVNKTVSGMCRLYLVRPGGVEPGACARAHVTELGLTRLRTDTKILRRLLVVNVDTHHFTSPHATPALRRTLHNNQSINQSTDRSITLSGKYWVKLLSRCISQFYELSCWWTNRDKFSLPSFQLLLGEDK